MSSPADAAKPGANDPAMDDILASIRRILNEDEATPAPARPEAPASAAAPAGEPLDLTESMLVQPAEPPPAGPTRSLPEAVAAEEALPPVLAAPVMPAALPQEEVAPAPSPIGPASASLLVAPAVAAATTAAVGKLLRAVVQERTSTVSRGGPSIEDVVREELRPLLKDWLDQHLPPLVERLVRAEIERVVGRAL